MCKHNAKGSGSIEPEVLPSITVIQATTIAVTVRREREREKPLIRHTDILRNAGRSRWSDEEKLSFKPRREIREEIERRASSCRAAEINRSRTGQPTAEDEDKHVRARHLTFTGVVGQDGARPHLLPLHVLARAGLRAGGPRRPVTEHAVPGARNLAGHRLWGRRRRAQAGVHWLTCRGRREVESRL